MTVHWNSASFSAATPAMDLAGVAALPYGVGFDLGDPALEAALRQGIREQGDMRETDFGTATVVVSDRTDSAGIESGRVVRLGGGGTRNVLETADPGLILAAVRLVAAGYSLDREPAPERRPSRSGQPHLSPRERQVAELLAEGASNKLIARDLDISVHTAKFHVTAVLEKLGARNRADAVGILLREGLLPV